MRIIALLSLVIILLFLPLFTTAMAASEPIVITEQSTFFDSSGRENVVGTVRNSGTIPSIVHLAVKIGGGDSSGVLNNLTYGRIVWPMTESPFKISLPSGAHTESAAYLEGITDINASQYSLLVLDYTNMGMGTQKALLGTVKNIGPFDVYNVSVFASVHDSKGAQIDTVRSSPISVLLPGEMRAFEAAPDPSIKDRVVFYSCAGLDANAPITTVNVGGGKFVAFQLQALAKIADFKYNSDSDSISLIVTPYGFNGGPFTMKLPATTQNQQVFVSIDGRLDQNATVKSDGRTLTANVFVPKGDHKVSIQGISTVPELSNFTTMFIVCLSFTVTLSMLARRSHWQMH